MAISDPNASQSLDRGLQLLKLLAAAPDGRTVTQIATDLDVSRQVVYRLLKPLLDHRMLIKHGSAYRLGMGLVELAGGAAPSLESASLPTLRKLADDLRQTATLTVSDGDDEAVAVAVAEPRGANLYVAYRVGLRHPIDRSAAGIAILAARPPARRERKAVRDARARGYCLSRAELQPGAYGLAAPIVIGGSADASVGVVSLEPLPERKSAQRVLDASRAIAAALS